MKPDTMYRFVQELKRRRVFRGIVVYGASTLVLFEAATNLANFFGQDSPPLWFVVLLGVGFFVSLWFSWIYDITPGGIRKTEPDSDNQVPIPKKEVRTYQTTTFISVLLIVGLVSYNIIKGAKTKMVRELDKSIAVLPFHDPTLSPSQARAYEFIGQELTACLDKVEDYRIIPWRDCRSYPRRNKPSSEIGNELKACLLLEWKPYESDEDRHLSIELISAQDAALVWSRIYPIKGAWAPEIRRLSKRISKKITRELRTYASPRERILMGEEYISAQASLYAAMGNAYMQDAWMQSVTGSYMEDEKNAYTDSISFSIAIQHFSDAIQEDPSFAEAYANRAKARLMGYRAQYFGKAVVDESWADIEKAFQLNEDLPEAHLAMGFFYYFGLEKYQMALLSIERACELKPGNSEYLFYLSKIYTTLGNWRQAHILCDRILETNPQNALVYTNLGLDYAYLNDFPKAIHCQNRAIELMPRWTAPYVNKAYTHAFKSEIEDARATVLDAQINTGNSFPRFLAELDLYEGKYSQAAKLIESFNGQEFKILQERKGDEYLILAKIYYHAGSTDPARKNYRQAVEYFTEQIAEHPENPYLHAKLSLAYAGTGDDKLAISTGQKAYALGKQNYNAFRFPFVLYDLVLAYTIADDNQKALHTLQELLDTRSLYTLKFMKTDPDLKPLLSQSGLEISNQ